MGILFQLVLLHETRAAFNDDSKSFCSLDDIVVNHCNTLLVADAQIKDSLCFLISCRQTSHLSHILFMPLNI